MGFGESGSHASRALISNLHKTSTQQQAVWTTTGSTARGKRRLLKEGSGVDGPTDVGRRCPAPFFDTTAPRLDGAEGVVWPTPCEQLPQLRPPGVGRGHGSNTATGPRNAVRGRSTQTDGQRGPLRRTVTCAKGRGKVVDLEVPARLRSVAVASSARKARRARSIASVLLTRDAIEQRTHLPDATPTSGRAVRFSTGRAGRTSPPERCRGRRARTGVSSARTC